MIFRAGGKTHIDRNGTPKPSLGEHRRRHRRRLRSNYTRGSVARPLDERRRPRIVVDACLTTYGEFTAVEAFLPLRGSPIRPVRSTCR
jgi:hypothetical protein